MKGCAGSCLGRMLMLILLIGATVVVTLRWGPDLLERVRGPRGAREAVEPTPELAADAEIRVRDLVEGSLEEISLSGAEVASLLRYRADGAWPNGVSDPTVVLRDGELRLGVRLARELIPNLPELQSITDFLPDTVPIHLRGRVLAVEGGVAALVVHRIDASAVPIPRRFFPRIIETFSGPGRDDLPPEAIALPLPPGIRSARVLGDRLVLSRLR